MSFGMQKKAGDDGGWHERQLCTTKQPRTPSVTRGQYSKRRAVETPVIFFRPGCKFGRESHFVASFMPIICILSPPMQFPFSGSGSARETPNKISGQGLRSWKKLYRPLVTLFDKILHLSRKIDSDCQKLVAKCINHSRRILQPKVPKILII